MDAKIDGSYDVVVIGGGPAGSATATLVTRGGRRVLLLERERFPRFRIGESLMPATYWTLKRLGVIDRMATLGSPRKHSVQFFLKDGRGTAPFYFSQVEDDESAVTWQVDRAAFDSMLLDNATEAGVQVRQETAVRDVLFDGDRAVGVLLDDGDRSPREVRASVVVDATGQSALLARKLRLKRWDPKLKHSALFTRFRGARRDEGIDEGATIILHTRTEDSWFWFIPLPGDLVSIGVVGPIGHLVQGRAPDPQRIFDEELAICPALQERLDGAEQVGAVRAIKDFSYISSRIAGDGWILVGDAFGFLDPIYSSGVFLALKSAEFAADAILEGLSAGDVSGKRLGGNGEQYVAGMEALRRLVYAYYDREFSFADFLREHPHLREELTHLLIGNVYRRSTNGLIEALSGSMDHADYEPLRLDGESGG